MKSGYLAKTFTVSVIFSYGASKARKSTVVFNQVISIFKKYQECPFDYVWLKYKNKGCYDLCYFEMLESRKILKTE